MTKIFSLVPIFVLAAIASANTCTNVYFKTMVNLFFNTEALLDAAYYIEHGDNAWANKWIYNNGKLEKMIHDPMEEGEEKRTLLFYSDTNETVIGDNESVGIISSCQSGDTSCFQIKNYYNGELGSIDSYKTADNYESYEDLYESSRLFSEYFLKQDTIIERDYNSIDSDTTKYQGLYVADATDDYKCYDYSENANTTYTIQYKPNDAGFSIVIESSTYFREFFFININSQTTNIKKILKPAKISPKARYFDLLGRYQFTK